MALVGGVRLRRHCERSEAIPWEKAHKKRVSAKKHLLSSFLRIHQYKDPRAYQQAEDDENGEDCPAGKDGFLHIFLIQRLYVFNKGENHHQMSQNNENANRTEIHR